MWEFSWSGWAVKKLKRHQVLLIANQLFYLCLYVSWVKETTKTHCCWMSFVFFDEKKWIFRTKNRR